MKKQFSQFTVPSWFKWAALVLLALLLILAIFFVYLYNNILNSRETGFDRSIELAAQETGLTETEEITRFHGSSLYHVITGRTEDGQEVLVFVPVDDEEAEVVVFNKQELLSRQAILDEWRSGCQDCQLQKFTYALSNENALLEIAYINENGRYVFDYFSLKDGKRYETLQLRRS